MQSDEKYKYFLGIDVSKSKLDIYNSETGEFTQVSNDIKSIQKYLKTITPKQDLLVVIDLTGGYEQKAVDLFYQTGFCVHRADGRRVKYFLRSFGQRAKTDKIDAQGLALYGSKVQENLMLYTPIDRNLLELSERLETLKSLYQQEKNRSNLPHIGSVILKSIQKHLRFLEKEIEIIEKQLQTLILTDKKLSEKYKIMTSVKGIGSSIAMLLISMLPELGELNRRQIASLAGLAPFAKDSGTINAARHIYYGRSRVKRALFMATLVAIQFNDKIKKFYNHLINDSEKKKMVAVTACMRKILIILNAKLKEINYACL